VWFIKVYDMTDDALNQQFKEWLAALADVKEFEGKEFAEELLNRLDRTTADLGLEVKSIAHTSYVNTLQDDVDADFDINKCRRVADFVRWNAMAMVVKAVRKASELGGHIGTPFSIADVYTTAYLYFFQGRENCLGGDLIFFQGHASPANYAFAYLQNRFTAEQLDLFRQELSGSNGLSSYPHPWLMPDFWQLPTVSMGLGPIMAVFQAHIMRYLENRGMLTASARKVWAFCGDGEMVGEPESVSALSLAAREHLDNLIFVVSCNLQRLDGPVIPYDQVVQQLEGIFRGAGWRTIKVIWGSAWDKLFVADTLDHLKARIAQLNDGEYQNYSAKGIAYLSEHFFNTPELKAMVAGWSDAELAELLVDGGHDFRRIYTALKAAVNTKGQPVVILAKTIKGFGLGEAQASNPVHNKKKMSDEEVAAAAKYLNIALSDDEIKNIPYRKPDADLLTFIKERTAAMGGPVPARVVLDCRLKAPSLAHFQSVLDGSGDREVSSTMMYGRIMGLLLRDKEINKYVVPILADEARTFGMEGLFRQIGIYSPHDQPYEPVDKDTLMYYKESKSGQLLQEGLSEANAMSTWVAAGSAYASYGIPLIPFYIYYSMFGYQRIGDLAWAAGDMRTKGFLIGGTAGRTTLAGEGLQHQDGHNLLMFDYVPNCRTYDPAYGYEMAVIIQDGIKRMYEEMRDEYYYITAMNENYIHPAMPAGVEEGILQGLYCFSKSSATNAKRVNLIGAGTILNEVISAAAILEADYGVSCDVYSATSFNLLRRDIEDVARYNLLHPENKKTSYVARIFADANVPTIAATDYVKSYAAQIRADVAGSYYVLGTDGYGRSDVRANLRKFFEVNTDFIVYTTLKALFDASSISIDVLKAAQSKHNINIEKANPVTE
jgi:pyruvate dehydrogenase E1 component